MKALSRSQAVGMSQELEHRNRQSKTRKPSSAGKSCFLVSVLAIFATSIWAAFLDHMRVGLALGVLGWLISVIVAFLRPDWFTGDARHVPTDDSPFGEQLDDAPDSHGDDFFSASDWD